MRPGKRCCGRDLGPTRGGRVGGVLGDEPLTEENSTVAAFECTGGIKIAFLVTNGLFAQLAARDPWPQASAKPQGHGWSVRL